MDLLEECAHRKTTVFSVGAFFFFYAEREILLLKTGQKGKPDCVPARRRLKGGGRPGFLPLSVFTQQGDL